MIKWTEERKSGGTSGSFENDDIRRSLEMLDDILAEYEHDSDNNCKSPSENHASYSRYNATRTRPPPPPEEAARVIVSYFPRCSNGGEQRVCNKSELDDLTPSPRHEPVNADACNNNAAYIDYELARLTDEYHLYEEKQKMATKRRSPLSVLSPPRDSSPRQTINRNAPVPPPPPQFLESRFPEFPEFQLRMTGQGNYRVHEDEVDEHYGETSESPEDSTDDGGFRSGSANFLDESGDSEDRSGSEECSSVIEVPLKVQPSSVVGPSGQQERPEDYVAVHPKKYFEGYPAAVDSSPAQVYSHEVKKRSQKEMHTLQFNEQVMDDDQMLLMDDDEEEEDELAVMDATLPPPPAFETPDDREDDEVESDQDSPNMMDDSEYFYDITRSADDLSNDDEDEANGEKMEEEEDEGTITNHSSASGERFSLVHQMYRDGSLDGIDDKPPEFKPPPPPSSRSANGEPFSSSASEDDDEEEEEECDEAHVRWRVCLPNKGRGLVFGTTILVMNRQVKTIARPSSVASSVTTVSSTRSRSTAARGIEPRMTSSLVDKKNELDESLLDDQDCHRSFSSVDIGSRSSLSSTSTSTQQRPVSAELLGLDKLPDVRSLVNSFNKKQVKEKKGHQSASTNNRRPSKEYVSTLRKELPLFINVPPVKLPGNKMATAPKPTTAKKQIVSSEVKTMTMPRPQQKTPKAPPIGICKSSTLSHFPKTTTTVVSRPSGAMTLPKRESSRAAKAMAMAMSLPLKAKNSFRSVTRPHTPQMEPTLRQTIASPSRLSSDDLPKLLSYRVVNNDNVPQNESSSSTPRVIKGATLPRISHETRRPPLTTDFGGPFSPPGKEVTRRTPPPPPPLTKGPPPKIFVEMQPSRSESSCTSSCSCLCTKHQSPCNSPVPPPMPCGQISDGSRSEQQQQHHVANQPTAIASTSRHEEDCPHGHGCGKGKGKGGLHFLLAVSSQPKKGKKPQQVKKSQQASEKSGSEQRNNALIMEIQAAIQHRKSSDQENKDDVGSESGLGLHGKTKNQCMPSPHSSTEKDKSMDKKGLFKGLWRRSKSDN